jgi:hypothetical protein
VLNITFDPGLPGHVSVGLILGSPHPLSGPANREPLPMPALRQLGPRLRSGRKAKAVRVTAISTDQLVPCPSCGGFMRLSEAQAFECRQCGRAIRVEGVLKSFDGE